MNVVLQVAPEVGAATVCAAIGLPRATFYRHRQVADRPCQEKPRPTPPRALSAEERRTVLDTLHSERFVDQAPAEVYATLLDEDRYLCSIRTMYRLLDVAQEVRERRDQLRHPQYHKPELLATGPNQVWSWDITKLLGPAKWSYFYLYVIMDIFSRYVVGWTLAQQESGQLASG
jgi:putative transposase